jgi:dolichyl-phosphate beta-glucosyltransferase
VPRAETVVAVPCYNEAGRLDRDAFLRFAAERPAIHFLFVNDGSTDDTLAVLRALAGAAGGAASVLDLRENRGKGEAVRAGLLRALESDPEYVAFWDADLATPLAELDRFGRVLAADPELLLVMGARVQLLGRAITRSPVRHYLGRVFATAASLALRLAVYDTQCGAKLLRVSPATRALFAEPFHSRWIFDVEILARMIAAAPGGSTEVARRVHECPVDAWSDIAGSKLRHRDFVRAVTDLWRIHATYLRPARRRTESFA